MNRKKLALVIPCVCIFACIFYSVGGSAQSCVQPPPGMVSWLPGDGNAMDIVGNNSGSLNGGAIFSPGHVGQAFDFYDVDDYVRIPADSSLEFSGDFSADFWVNMDTLTPCNYKGFLHHQDFINRKGWIIVDNCKSTPYVIFRTLAGGVWDAQFNRSLLVPGTWHHIAGVHEGSTNKIYLDGVLQHTVFSAGFQPNVGADLLSGSNVDGRIDEIEVFNRALSASEIQAIYNAGSAGKCKFVEVEIDIKPGSDPNSINLCSSGNVPVAILGTDDYDVLDFVTGVDPDTITLADASVRTVGKGNKLMCHEDDVNSDGLWDLVCQIPTVDLTVELGITDTTAELNAQTYEGNPVAGSDAIRIVKDCN